MAARYLPDRGDLVWLTPSPQSGHEQAGRRPALVLTPKAYNRKVGLALFCPITTRVKGYPFEVAIPASLPVGGVVLSDQIKSLDWQAREAVYAATLPDENLAEVLGKVASLLQELDG